MTIKREGGKKYHISWSDWQTTYDGYAYLVKLDDRQFLEFDLTSMTSRNGDVIERPDNFLGNSVDTLYFARLHRVNDHLRIGFPRVEDFKLAAKTSDDLVGFERGKSFIFTSTTEQLQKFLAATDDRMYRSSEVFVRAGDAQERQDEN